VKQSEKDISKKKKNSPEEAENLDDSPVKAAEHKIIE